MKESKTTIDDLARMVADGFAEMKERMDRLEIGQEDIKLRLDNAAWRFEFKALDKRVTVLEKKVKFV